MSRVLALSALVTCVALGGCRPARPGQAVEECIPGETVIVGCAQTCGIGSCTGDPVLRFCDGTLGIEACRSSSDTTAFVEVDDSCSSACPRARVTCPISGSLAIVARPLFSSSSFTCDWEIEHRGILPPGGRAPETIACAPGAPIQIGCSLGCGIGECSGTAAIRTCDGTASVADCQSGAADSLRETSGSSGCGSGCPEYVLDCPPSGALTIVPRNTSSSGGADYVCDWDARPAPHRAGGTEVCSPGGRYFVGCAAGCMLGQCRGNGTIRVCDGNITPEACLALTDTTMVLASSSRSDCDGECPQAEVVCPGSGAVTIVSRSSYEDEGFGCDWAMRPAGIGE